ncbi:hypothetical protein BA896_015585 [Janthinobacterium lividum]|uniref:Uncharacterized protein n=1 Tax=Janthinobacterium lividum TaxID=29581 RepID=A0A1E8PMS6_9BURK|nr:hypothetical protein BA896_015585 [Janthinobacterium lividum]
MRMAHRRTLRYSADIANRPPDRTDHEHAKKHLENMEAIFTIAVAIACGASYASYASFTQPTAAVTSAAVQTGAIPVVVVSAKRMTEQEKKISLIEERQALLANANASAL